MVIRKESIYLLNIWGFLTGGNNITINKQHIKYQNIKLNLKALFTNKYVNDKLYIYIVRPVSNWV